MLHERGKVVERGRALFYRAQAAREAAQTQVSAQTSHDLRALRQAQIQLAVIAEQERIRYKLEAGTIRHLFRIGLRLQALQRRQAEATDEVQACIAELDQAITELRGDISGLGAPAGGARGGPTAEWPGASRSV